MGLQGMIDDLVQKCDQDITDPADVTLETLKTGDPRIVARALTLAEADAEGTPAPVGFLAAVAETAKGIQVPILGITGTGGAGKSSLVDEIVRRYALDHPDHRIAILAVDPSRKRTGGALLGDRIRMNAIYQPGTYMRSFATRGQKGELSAAVRTGIDICKVAGFDLVCVETSGIGQGDSDIIQVADLSFYVMTPEYGASSQLEKIDMLDFAEAVILNKFERQGGEDALRDIRKQVRRNRNDFACADDTLPVFATIASQYHDPGCNALYLYILGRLQERGANVVATSRTVDPGTRSSPPRRTIIPPHRERYLHEIAQSVRDYKTWAREQADLARRLNHLDAALVEVPDAGTSLATRRDALAAKLDPRAKRWLDGWPTLRAEWSRDQYVYTVRDREIKQPLRVESLSHSMVPRVSLPRFQDPGDLLWWGLTENLPGQFPYTAGVFPLKRTFEDPKRMFAGEGGPARTNARFHYLCAHEKAKRLSTAFDSATLYGQDPDERPDIWGKIGESGVSVPHLDDMKILYSGFDLCSPMTSVSMTINGPAPILLAMFMNTALDQQVEIFRAKNGRSPADDERAGILSCTLSTVRGTVQADILKEDQGQNTCIFSTEFALKMMGDIQQFFVDHDVRNYYSVSISGYHIAEAGANPITQLAFTLANGFTYVEYYLSRGMKVNDFAPNFSYFFSVGLEPEYTVMGRVARRIWAIVLDRKYGGDARAQMLKYHIQTSGRSLHARDIQFNDIRTTLQALLAFYDNCQSLHTNAYDEAITTPTEESVRRAMAIQMIITKEFGLTKNENPLQGAFIVDDLTELVEEAVLDEFDRISRRGGVLGAMETQYQRGKIQDESMQYEHKKHDGSYPIVGINCFQDPTTLGADWELPAPPLLTRSTPDEKNAQISALRAFQAKHASHTADALALLQKTALEGGNLFAVLMDVVRVASLGQITKALFQVGGEYRRNL